jgi:hypothetical protein
MDPKNAQHLPDLPGVTIRQISLHDRSASDRHFIPNVMDFGVASTLTKIEEILESSNGSNKDLMTAFLTDVADTRRELLSGEPDQGKICVGLAVIGRFLTGSARGNLFPPEIAVQVPAWVEQIEGSYKMVFLSFEQGPDKWIAFLNTHFGSEHRVRAVAEFDGIEE